MLRARRIAPSPAWSAADGRLRLPGAAVRHHRSCISAASAGLDVECNRCKTRAVLPSMRSDRRVDTPLWKLEPSLKMPILQDRQYGRRWCT